MLATLQAGNNTQHLWMIAAGLGVGFLVVTGLVVYLMRKFFQSTREEQKKEFKTSAPRTENPSAFMAASMQGVIQKLREQEKELTKEISKLDTVVEDAARAQSPKSLARYSYSLATTFNLFYEHVPVLKEDNKQVLLARLALVKAFGITLRNTLRLLGITALERM